MFDEISFCGALAVLLVERGARGFNEKEDAGEAGIIIFRIKSGKMEPFATLVTTAGKVVYLEDSCKQESLKMGEIRRLCNRRNVSGGTICSRTRSEYNVLTTSKQGIYKGSFV